MVEEVMSCGAEYARYILSKWIEVIELGEEFRLKYLLGDVDLSITYMYVAKLTRLWGELYPKLEGRSDLSELVTHFKEFEPYYYDCSQLIDPKKAEELYKLEMALRIAIEKLGISRYER